MSSRESREWTAAAALLLPAAALLAGDDDVEVADEPPPPPRAAAWWTGVAGADDDPNMARAPRAGDRSIPSLEVVVVVVVVAVSTTVDGAPPAAAAAAAARFRCDTFRRMVGPNTLYPSPRTIGARTERQGDRDKVCARGSERWLDELRIYGYRERDIHIDGWARETARERRVVMCAGGGVIFFFSGI